MTERAYPWFTVRALPRRPRRKTLTYEIRSASSGALLGTIAWYAPWRQFTFAPAPDTIWSMDCLTDVADALAAAHVAHRAGPGPDVGPRAGGGAYIEEL